MRRATTKCTRFLSTPSGWRATLIDLMRCGKEMHFYPRPPGGGRRCDKRGGGYCYRFLSTPSGWRATRAEHITINDLFISIHALRVEGDKLRFSGMSVEVIDFYPRPPGGGRPRSYRVSRWLRQTISIHALRVEGDRKKVQQMSKFTTISIHALRVEGDRSEAVKPPNDCRISIHALRVEGDDIPKANQANGNRISIHALRVEGDRMSYLTGIYSTRFLSTPSGWRATTPFELTPQPAPDISIHALRVEGDRNTVPYIK